jgi:hypothetical protein
LVDDRLTLSKSARPRLPAPPVLPGVFNSSTLDADERDHRVTT